MLHNLGNIYVFFINRFAFYKAKTTPNNVKFYNIGWNKIHERFRHKGETLRIFQ